MIGFEEALKRTLAACPVLGREEVPLGKSLGRTLAQDVLSRIDSPPFDRAAMDGYAVSEGALTGGPVTLEVAGAVMAGQSAALRVSPGTCAKIMTGAMVPKGAKAVVPLERVTHVGNSIQFSYAADEKGNIAWQGEDAKAGQRLLASGARVTPSLWTILATNNVSRVTVRRLPRVAVLATGEEILPLGKRLRRGQIVDCNSWTIAGMVRQARMGEVCCLGVMADDPARLEAGLRSALANSDLVVLSGGVSMGDKDYVPHVVANLGGTALFHKVAIKPGKPLLLAKRGRTIVFGLPGNPVAVLATMAAFVLPCLRAMTEREPVLPRLHAKAGAAFRADKERQRLAACRLCFDGRAQLQALPTRYHGPGDIPSVAEMDGFALIDVGKGEVRKGGKVSVLPLPWWQPWPFDDSREEKPI